MDLFLYIAQKRPAFTLVEMLVVISIIVVLLALLIPGMSKAIRYAERSRCAGNQRGIAQVLAGYALNHKNLLPPSVAPYSYDSPRDEGQGAGPVVLPREEGFRFTYAMDYRAVDELATPQEASKPPAYRRIILGPKPSKPVEVDEEELLVQGALGLGLPVAMRLLPRTKLGEIAHCPSLNTASATPTPNFGTDNTYKIAPEQTPENRSRGGDGGAGGSYWIQRAHLGSRIVGSYSYRGTSYAFTNGGFGVISYADVGPTFAILSDLTDPRFGRKYCHRDGFNVAYADGHVSYYSDPGRVSAIEDAIFKSDAGGAPANEVKSIDGRSYPQVDEMIYEHYFSTAPR